MSKSEITDLIYHLVNTMPNELINIITSYLIFLPIKPVLKTTYKYDYHCILANDSVATIYSKSDGISVSINNGDVKQLSCGELLCPPVRFKKGFVSYTKSGFVIFNATTFAICGQNINPQPLHKQPGKLWAVGNKLIHTNQIMTVFNQDLKPTGMTYDFGPYFGSHDIRSIPNTPLYYDTCRGLDVFDDEKCILSKNLADFVGVHGDQLVATSNDMRENMHSEGSGALIIRGGVATVGHIYIGELFGASCELSINGNPIDRYSPTDISGYKSSRMLIFDSKLNIIKNEKISTYDHIWAAKESHYIFSHNYVYEFKTDNVLDHTKSYIGYNADYFICDGAMVDSHDTSIRYPFLDYEKFRLPGGVKIDSGWIIYDGVFYKPVNV